MAERVDAADVQGLVLTGYGRLRAACYLLLEVVDAPAARGWLGGVADEITVALSRPATRALNVALTMSGLRRLGLPSEALGAFSLEFQEGMTSSHRSRLLGDQGAAAPGRWLWGGPTGPVVDVLLLLFATDEDTLTALSDAHREGAEAHGLRHVTTLHTFDVELTEHFGFRDAVSQPSIAGFGLAGSALHTVRAGEFLLGYLNEHGQYTDRPLLDSASDPGGLLPPDPGGSGYRDLGRNGSYLVFRQLRQDVATFWRFVDEATRNADGSDNPEERTRLAARMVGRWPSGAPLTTSPDRDRPDLVNDNDFGYHALDPYGLRCPIGSHVRRTNPRDSLPPGPGTSRSVEVGKRHRILRRGRKYGRPIDRDALLAGTVTAEGDRGLHFLCLCANIARQFEFIQSTWVLNPHFAGLYDDADPLLSGHAPGGRSFTVQARPVRQRTTGLPAFVTVRGGAYFFLPGLRATRYLASLGS
jgi:Dyp-type peroxidase family